MKEKVTQIISMIAGSLLATLTVAHIIPESWGVPAIFATAFGVCFAWDSIIWPRIRKYYPASLLHPDDPDIRF